MENVHATQKILDYNNIHIIIHIKERERERENFLRHKC